MNIIIENKQFDLSKITQLYPAAIIKTGYKEETTQVSLEWLELEAKDKVELTGYGIFVHLGDDEKYSFVYQNREELDEAISKLASQLK